MFEKSFLQLVRHILQNVFSICTRFPEKREKLMNKQNSTVMKLAETALLAALCYVSFTFLQIKIPVPGGDATSLQSEIPSACLALCFLAVGTAVLLVLLE